MKRELLNLHTSLVLLIFLLIIVVIPAFAGTSETPVTIYGDTDSPTPTQTSTLILIQEDTPTPTQTPTAPSISTLVPTETTTPTPTPSGTPTETPTPTSTSTITQMPTPTETATPQSTSFLYIPYLFREYANPSYTPTPPPPPPETLLYCDGLSHPINIPDNDPNGINDDISIADERLVVGLNLYLNISHTWVGDLVVTLTNQSTGDTITALDRPGVPDSNLGCGNNNIITVLDDGAAQPAEDKCAAYPAAISGIFQPNELLSAYVGRSISGTWSLNISDQYANDTGSLNHWCLEARIASVLPPPTPTPTPVYLPPSAYVDGMSGEDQQLPLDCESRSAVDWASHFGFNIDELDFLNNLPSSDDPDSGFVGDPNGVWGNVPPNDYGVHAMPISALLQDYGLTASSYRSLRWDDLRAEITSGQPVIVWIIGGSSRNLVNGIPHFYTAASNNNTSIVAQYEHTVILVGYTPTNVTVLNGSRFVDVPLTQFLDSWSVLRFMAVLSRP